MRRTLRAFLLAALCNACAPRIAPPPAGESVTCGSLEQTLAAQCVGPRFSAQSGHYIFRATLQDLASSAQDAALRSVVSVSLRAYDKEGHPLEPSGQYLSKTKPAADLTASFQGLLVQDIPPQLHARTALHSGEYPLDDGWLPPGTASAELTIRIAPKSMITLSDLRVHYSKWNYPLAQRIPPGGEQDSPSPVQLAPIAVNSIGTARDQLHQLQSAKRFWKPRGPVLIFIVVHPSELRGHSPSKALLALADFLGAWSKQDPRISFGISINPYWNAKESARELVFSKTSSLRQITAPTLAFLERGASALMIRMDDFAPHSDKDRYDYVLSSKADIERFSSLAAAHSSFVNAAVHRLIRVYPNTRFAYVPPWYTNYFLDRAPAGESYLRELDSNTTNVVNIVWTGPSVRSLSIDDLHLLRIRKFVARHRLILWDNSLYARKHRDFWYNRPERLPLCSFIEPYDVRPPSSLIQPGDLPPLLLNTGLDPLNRLQLEGAQLFLTVPDDYYPERALFHVLESTYGTAGASLLVRAEAMIWERRAQIAAGASHAERDRLRMSHEALLRDLEEQIGGSAPDVLEQIKALMKTTLSEESASGVTND